mmetsp:Transcript_3383/g.9048  ORF Transcript_3383/g.9048 Transcript_3383/m.9048 type:complete len:200 (+) Transcript_3383:1888-2487(+)
MRMRPVASGAPGNDRELDHLSRGDPRRVATGQYLRGARGSDAQLRHRHDRAALVAHPRHLRARVQHGERGENLRVHRARDGGVHGRDRQAGRREEAAARMAPQGCHIFRTAGDEVPPGLTAGAEGCLFRRQSRREGWHLRPHRQRQELPHRRAVAPRGAMRRPRLARRHRRRNPDPQGPPIADHVHTPGSHPLLGQRAR